MLRGKSHMRRFFSALGGTVTLSGVRYDRAEARCLSRCCERINPKARIFAFHPLHRNKVFE